MATTTLRGTARHAFLATLVAIAVVVAAVAMWKLRLLLSLLFLALIIAAAMRPGVERLAARGVPRALGVLVHYLALGAVLALLLWLVVPQALGQVEAALGNVPSSRAEVHRAVSHSTGIRHGVLVALERGLRDLPPITSLVPPALSVTTKMFEALLGTLFVLASAAYWTLERERVEAMIVSLLPACRRRLVHRTWRLVELKLGAFVRGQLLLMTVVSTVLSAAFWGIGLPYWLLLGVFAGVVEIIPVIGPFAAASLAVGVGLTVSWHTAALAAITVYGLRLIQDYVLGPRVLGHAVALTPLVVLVCASAVGLLLGPATVPLATPFAAVLATLVDVVIRGRDPAEEEPPSVLSSGKETGPSPSAKARA
jgi:predicted PurR-regulated permease PerM